MSATTTSALFPVGGHGRSMPPGGYFLVRRKIFAQIATAIDAETAWDEVAAFVTGRGSRHDVCRRVSYGSR